MDAREFFTLVFLPHGVRHTSHSLIGRLSQNKRKKKHEQERKAKKKAKRERKRLKTWLDPTQT